MNELELRQFLEKLASGEYSDEEYSAFVNWSENCTREEYHQLLVWWEEVVDAAESFDAVSQHLIENIERGLDQVDQRRETPVIPIYRKGLWRRIAAAASILVFLSIGGYFLLHKQKPQQIAQNKPIDIKPGSKKAILTLSTGKQISLTDALAGTLAKQGNTTVAKTTDGQVVYNEEKSVKAEPALVYNTITTPRAGYYPLKMVDGTIAILDAESSIKYPVAFNGSERLVEITGQVYFEVAHNSSKPFRVKVKGQVIEDLGTHFNINAYDDETVIRTTLVEGSIRVSKNGSAVVIIPGQQAVTKPINDEIAVKDVNTDDVIAWKNGQTSFKNEDIQEIMRQVSRWYDVDIEYQGEIPKRQFVGGISRNANLSDLLKILEFNNIHFMVEGKKIIVKP